MFFDVGVELHHGECLASKIGTPPVFDVVFVRIQVISTEIVVAINDSNVLDSFDACGELKINFSTREDQFSAFVDDEVSSDEH